MNKDWFDSLSVGSESPGDKRLSIIHTRGKKKKRMSQVQDHEKHISEFLLRIIP